jgi:hypothetical protein
MQERAGAGHGGKQAHGEIAAAGQPKESKAQHAAQQGQQAFEATVYGVPSPKETDPRQTGDHRDQRVIF